MSLNNLKKEVSSLGTPERALVSARFFKTGKGEYGEGDVFVGLTVPQSRKIAVNYKDLSLEDIKKLLQSKIHEERLIALLILVHNFQKGDEKARKKIYDYYLTHTQYINNWDLVDLSADKIVGEYLYSYVIASDSEAISVNKGIAASSTPRNDVLVELAHSENLWERRIAMVATYAFIKNSISKPTLEIAEILLSDKNDLIQKAVGWMLREVGKRCSESIEEKFLQKYYQKMGRTALRYAIEHFSKKKRKAYMKK